eukprot:m.102788 g.102788  ORF g.102788 m.102788 type:complete len:879 (+) comp9086_c0_seq1:44-2680(+)
MLLLSSVKGGAIPCRGGIVASLLPNRVVLNSQRTRFHIGTNNYAPTTPTIKEYISLKNTVPSHPLVMQVGSFYELYANDAQLAVKKLPLAITQKGMAGFPMHRKDSWIPQFLHHFKSVAIAEQQLEVGSTERKIVRILTPGTLLPDVDVDEDIPRTVVAITADCPINTSMFGVSTYDNITGRITKETFTLEQLSRELPGREITELLLENPTIRVCMEASARSLKISNAIPLSLVLVPLKCFKETYVMSVPTEWSECDREEDATLANRAFSMLQRYLKRNFPPDGPQMLHKEAETLERVQKSPQTSEEVFHMQNSHLEHLTMDADTRAALNLTIPKGEGSLLHVIDYTTTTFGRRELHDRVANPLIDIKEINRRLDLVEFFSNHLDSGSKLHNLLRGCPDALRCLPAIAADRITMEKRLQHLLRLRVFQEKVDAASLTLHSILPGCTEEGVKWAYQLLVNLDAFKNNDSIRNSGRWYDEDTQTFPRPGFSNVVDELVANVLSIETAIVAYANDIESQTNAKTSLVKKDNDFMIRVTKANFSNFSKKVKDAVSVKSSLYTTPTLDQLKSNYNRAQRDLDRARMDCAIEICNAHVALSSLYTKTQAALAHLDISIGLAEAAAFKEYVRPFITTGTEFCVMQGIHPILEAAAEDDIDTVLHPNDCDLGPHSTMVITGPNMGGKSTFLRQNALIVVLAQLGSFVPAESCTLGVVDRLFTRVGAQDDQMQGKSTFFVEMEETANILNNATSSSFVVMDEVGRGTNSIEGLSLALAITKHLANTKCRTLSVTHHTQLAQLCEAMDNVAVYKFVAVPDSAGNIVFEHAIHEGIATDAHAIAVAKYAGHKNSVINTARIVLNELHKQGFGHVDLASIHAVLDDADAA